MIIGIVGRKHSGKDTLADLIQSTPGFKGYERRKFATSLRKVLYEATGITVEESESDEGKVQIVPGTDITVGRVLQVVGGTMRDILGTEIWINAFSRQWLKDGSPDVVITDVRHLNEAAWIVFQRGLLIRIVRDETEEGSNDGRDPNHGSETEVDQIAVHITVKNDGDLDHLKKLVESVVRAIYAMKMKS
jgi:hypothetical protein